METKWLSTLLNVLYRTMAYPLLLVIYWILVLLYWIASPLIYLGHFIIEAGLLPVRFLAKLEVRSLFEEVLAITNVHIVRHSMSFLASQSSLD
jgi:low affinity Fe/Cu permease